MIVNNAFTFDEPYDYKGIKIYPVKLKEFFMFYYGLECLLIDKNSIPDSKIISMSYLDFLINTSNEENKNLEKLAVLLYIVTKTNPEEIGIQKTDRGYYKILMGKNNNVVITSDDFEKIKEIILEQNLIESPDYTIQKEIRDKIEEGKRIKNKSIKMASLEDQMISLSSATGISLESIFELTYRKFVKYLERADLLLHYKIYLSSSMSGMVTFKDTSFIKHWLSQSEKESKGGLISAGDVENKMSFKDKKK